MNFKSSAQSMSFVTPPSQIQVHRTPRLSRPQLSRESRAVFSYGKVNSAAVASSSGLPAPLTSASEEPLMALYSSSSEPSTNKAPMLFSFIAGVLTCIHKRPQAFPFLLFLHPADTDSIVLKSLQSQILDAKSRVRVEMCALKEPVEPRIREGRINLSLPRLKHCESAKRREGQPRSRDPIATYASVPLRSRFSSE